MKKNISLRLQLLSILFFLPSLLIAYIDEPYHDTAFIGPANTFYGFTYYSYYRTDSFWNKHGKKLSAFNTFQRHSYRLDMEYAIDTSNSVFLKSGYATVDEKINRNSRGFEDIEASYQHLFRETTKSAFSARLTGIIPTGKRNSCIRYGKAGGELKFLYSQCFDFYKKNCWMDLTTSYRFYTGYPSDQIRATASFGCNLLPNFWLLSSTQLYYGLFNGHENTNRNNLYYNPNFRLLSTQVQAIIELQRHFSISLGGFAHLWGENIGAGGGFYGGTWIIF